MSDQACVALTNAANSRRMTGSASARRARARAASSASGAACSSASNSPQSVTIAGMERRDSNSNGSPMTACSAGRHGFHPAGGPAQRGTSTCWWVSTQR